MQHNSQNGREPGDRWLKVSEKEKENLFFCSLLNVWYQKKGEGEGEGEGELTN
jgi:hypothetical protein